MTLSRTNELAGTPKLGGESALTMTVNGKAVWVTWETQPRNRSMARELDVPLFVFDFRGGRVKRQWRAIRETLRLLWARRPAVVFAPNPSLVLTYLLLACRFVFRYRFVCDAHYGGVIDVTGSRLVQRLLNFANRHADLVIVTNAGHAERVRQCGGTPFVCPDPLPQIPPTEQRPALMNGTEKSVLFICSYDADEPFNEVFEAARALADRGFRLFASGRYGRAGITAAAHPHVELLGFVDRATYDAYLHNVDIVLDLTTWQDCLVCGAYEAMAAGKPCVLSRTKALSELFTHGTVFCSHEPSAITEAVLRAYEQRSVLKSQISEWTTQHQRRTRDRVEALRATLQLNSFATT